MRSPRQKCGQRREEGPGPDLETHQFSEFKWRKQNKQKDRYEALTGPEAIQEKRASQDQERRDLEKGRTCQGDECCERPRKTGRRRVCASGLGI